MFPPQNAVPLSRHHRDWQWQVMAVQCTSSDKHIHCIYMCKDLHICWYSIWDLHVSPFFLPFPPPPPSLSLSLSPSPFLSLPLPPSPGSAAVPVLLAILRVLLNLTHDNELGSHRLGEQEGAVKTVLDIVFLVRGGEGEGGRGELEGEGEREGGRRREGGRGRSGRREREGWRGEEERWREREGGVGWEKEGEEQGRVWV